MIGLIALVQMAAADPVCIRAEVVPGFEAWRHAAGSTLALGTPASLSLTPVSQGEGAPVSGRRPVPGSFGATVPLTIRKAGTYQVALGAGGWIDLVRDGKAIASTAHRHGPVCSGLVKIVSFALRPGRYQLQLSEVKAPDIRVMVIGG